MILPMQLTKSCKIDCMNNINNILKKNQGSSKPLFYNLIHFMFNCKLETLRGYSHKLPNAIINCHWFMGGGIFMPLANSVQFFNGVKSTTIYQTKREISALDMKGNMLIIGEKASPGQLISAILVNVQNPESAKIFSYQKTQISQVAISSNLDYFCSIGGSSELIDELNIIEINNQSQVGTKVFYSKQFKKKDGKIISVKFSNNDPTFFVVLCTNKFIFYRIDEQIGSVEETVGKASRIRQYTSFTFSPDDQFLYLASQNGDISEISVQEGKQVRIGPRRRVITKGISTVTFLHPRFLIFSGKEGLIGQIDLKEMQLVREVKLQEDQVISISDFKDGQAFIATNRAIIFRLKAEKLHTELYYTSCSTKINSIAFLKDYSDIFGTCSGGQITIWKTKTLAPALRISLAKTTCLSLHFPKNGKYIVSGWSDDSIRIFSPQNGKLIHRITPCNLQKVVQIISDDDATIIICGGQNGIIRVWNILQTKIFGLIKGSLAFHMHKVNCLRINPYNFDEMISCCQDGQYAVWKLSKFQLKHHFYICSFLKDFLFIDQLSIRLVGCGNIVYQCFIADGVIKRQVAINGTCINSIADCYLNATHETLLFVGTDQPYLHYFDVGSKKLQLSKLQSFGEIVKIVSSPDTSSMIAVTDNGVILNYSVFSIKKNKEEESWF